MRLRHRMPAVVLTMLAFICGVATIASPASKTAPAVTSAKQAKVVPDATPLERGRELYRAGQFVAAAELIRSGIRDSAVVGTEVIDGTVLIARCMIRAGHPGIGREIFRGLLVRMPGYRPDLSELAVEERVPLQAVLVDIETRRLSPDSRGEAAAPSGPGPGGTWPGYLGATVAVRTGGAGDLAELAAENGRGALEQNLEFGFDLGFPLSDRMTLEFEAFRLESQVGLEYPGGLLFAAKMAGHPAVLNLAWVLRSSRGSRSHLFLGAGPMLSSELELVGRTETEGSLLSRRTGWFAHAGIGFERGLGHRLAIGARVSGRLAQSGRLDFGASPEVAVLDVNGRKIQFSSAAVQVALHAYLGR